MNTPQSGAPAIYGKLAAIMAEVEAIGKDKKNEQQNFKFRGIDDVYNALHPILAKHGVFSAPEVVKVEREERQTSKGGNLLYSIVTMRHHFFATDGSCVSTTVVGEGMDSGDKASNKAMAVAHKYALLQLLCIPTADMEDPDKTTHEVKPKVATPPAPPAKITQAQINEITSLTQLDVSAVTRLRAAFAHYRVTTAEDLTEADAAKIIAALKKPAPKPAAK